MSELVFVNIVVEDVLSEILLKKIIENTANHLKVSIGHWSLKRAIKNSRSLEKLVKRLKEL